MGELLTSSEILELLTKEEVPVAVEAEEITVKVSPKNPPESANPHHVAARVKQLRLMLKQLAAPQLDPSIDAAFQDLEKAITSRTTKETRLQALHRVREVLAVHTRKQAERFQQSHTLVQGIPTQVGLPVTNSDNIVRAIVAILRTNGALNE